MCWLKAHLKGNQTKDTSWLENREKVEIFLSVHASFSSANIYTFICLNLRSSGCSHAGLLFPNEEH